MILDPGGRWAALRVAIWHRSSPGRGSTRLGLLAPASDMVCLGVCPRLVSQPNAAGVPDVASFQRQDKMAKMI
jgi:hypothetical protein